MFLIGAFHSSIIFLNFQQYFSPRNSTLAFKNYSLEFKIQLQKFFLTCCHEILFIENKSSRQTAAYFVSEHGSNATQNFNSLVAKHVMLSPNQNMFFRHMYTLKCNQGYSDKAHGLVNSDVRQMKYLQTAQRWVENATVMQKSVKRIVKCRHGHGFPLKT